ncbi:hypothetical protein G6F55_013678 [Rhizopus delemar]|nr:hypothetical protein G6F55_013678 [Rhizopus delemar]
MRKYLRRPARDSSITCALVGDLGQGAVVVQAVDDQQHHDARQQQDDKQRADADAWHPGYPQAHSGFRCGGLAGDAFQHVAQPAHGHDAHVAAGQLLAQTVQHDLDGVGVGFAVVREDLAEQLRLVHGVAAAGQQRRQGGMFATASRTAGADAAGRG